MNKYNEKVFTTIGKTHGAPCTPATRKEWEALRREPWLRQMCERIANGNDEEKHRLPVWTPHCAEFRNNHRAIADALKPLSRLMLDFDEKGHTDDIVAKFNKVNGEMKVGTLTVLLVEESVRKGTHVLVELPEDMNADEAQRLVKEATGFEPDKAVKDVSRCIYMVSEEHTRYVAEKLFEPDCQAKQEPQQPKKAETATATESSTTAQSAPPTFKGIPYEDIIELYWLRTGGIPTEGERNVKLHKLAVNLRSICDNRKELLMQVMPHLGLADSELKSIIDSACKEEPKGISRLMQDIIDTLKNKADEADAEQQERAFVLKPAMRRALPRGLKESLVGVPENMQMPVLCATLPIAAAYADQVEVEYCDGNRQHLGLMSIIRGEQASGKSVCKSVVDIWKRQFDEEDAAARKREEEWKERRKGRKANEKAPDDPHVLIRALPITVSCSTLLKRMKNAQGHTLYSFCEELDTLRKTNGAGSWSSKYDIYRLSFDKGEWGQDYNSDQAESGVVRVAYNWTILGTNGAMRKCFKADNIENGLSSRILVAEMPDTSFSKMPRYGKRSEAEVQTIQEAATMLRGYSGYIDTPRLREAIDEWVEKKRIIAAKNIDRVMDTYRKRAAVIGFRCGVVYFLLSGKKKESKQCIEFALMMAEYCLAQQIKAFGEVLQGEFVSAASEGIRYSQNRSVFDCLPPVFTMNDLRAQKQGTTESGIRNITSRWHRDGWIEKIDAKHWKKASHMSHVPLSQ